MKIDDKLYELQKVCCQYQQTDPLAVWVLYAISRHISTGRATRAFLESFVSYPSEKLADLIKECLNGDRSDDGIIKTVKKAMGRREKQ